MKISRGGSWVNFSKKEPSFSQTRPCCCHIAQSPDRSMKRSAYVSCVSHYKVIIYILTHWACVCFLCVWREIVFMWVTWEGCSDGKVG